MKRFTLVLVVLGAMREGFYYFGTAVTHDKSHPRMLRYEGGIGRFLLRVTK